MHPGAVVTAPPRTILGFTPYQWLVLFAAWLGWGFDVFDGLLFNYVARDCIPTLLGYPVAEWPAHKETIIYWNGALASALLLGWAAGGIIFGKITDKLGRTRTMLLTMLTYALATAACAGAQNIWMLLGLRFIASLGIGGEWAAGASLVAETVPEEKRVTAGALLYTSAPLGMLVAGFVADLFTKQLDGFAKDPTTAWRYVFLTGLIPAVVAFVLRLFIREPEGFERQAQAPRVRELFAPERIRHTVGGLAMAMVALVTWWSVSAFIPLIAGFLANDITPKLTGAALAARQSELQFAASNWFCTGGLIGTLLTVPVAKHLGRRPMFAIYFTASAAAVGAAFGLHLSPDVRVILFGLIGVSVFGVFGSFTFYLPELFPRRLRGTGAGFCYNTGRIFTAAFPFGIGLIVLEKIPPLDVIRWVALVPVVGLVLLATGAAEETRGRTIT
jgi:MFS family permease